MGNGLKKNVVFLSDEQREWLKAQSKKKLLTVSEIIRTTLNEAMKTDKKNIPEG